TQSRRAVDHRHRRVYCVDTLNDEFTGRYRVCVSRSAREVSVMVVDKRPARDELIHTPPEMAVAEADVRSAEAGEFVRGTSLWRDAWRRLLRNKLAVFGLVVVAIITVASILGPTIIKSTLGFTPDYNFSWTHPMGTDNAGRDQLARVLQGGQISLFVGIIATLVSLIIGVSYGAIAGYVGGRIDDVMMRIVDVLYSLPYVILVIVLLSMFRSQTPRGQLVLLFVALGSVSWLTMARIVRGQVL